MAFTVQDDNGSVADANAYISVAFFTTYHADRAQTYTGDTAAIQAAIVRATQYLDTRFTFVGYVPNVDQTTKWPRLSARDNNDRLRYDIPREIKNATAEYARIALAATLNPTPTRDEYGVSIKSRSSRAGPVSESFEYADGAVFKMPKYPIADQWLIASGLVERSGRINRG
jgi:hypothetical protein